MAAVVITVAPAATVARAPLIVTSRKKRGSGKDCAYTCSARTYALLWRSTEFHDDKSGHAGRKNKGGMGLSKSRWGKVSVAR
jgi:hypothetical protein